MLWLTLRQLKSDNPATRVRAVEKLARSRSEQAIELLTKALKDKEGSVREAAARALGEIGDAAGAAPLVALLDQGEPLRAAATEALNRIGKPAVEVLLETLKNGPDNTAREAASVLTSLGWQPTNDVERIHLAIALRHWGDAAHVGKMAVEPLVAVLKDQFADECRAGAARALGIVRDPGALAALRAALKDASQSVRTEAATALANIGGPEAFDALATALDSEHSVTRRDVVSQLIVFNEAAVDKLLLALWDKNASVRKAALAGLLTLGWQPADDQQRALLEVARERWSAAAELGAVALEPLARALKSEDWLTEHPAELDARGAMGKARAEESSAEQLKRKSPPQEVAKAIALALGKVDHADAVQPLLSVIREIEGVAANEALRGLQSLLETRAREIAVEDLRDLAALEQAEHVYYTEVNVCENVRLTERSVHSVDCSLIRQLARQELIHRGLEA